MKKFIHLLPILMLALIMGACGDSETMKQLDGTWQTEMTEHESGETLNMLMTMQLDEASASGNIKMDVSTSSVDDFFTVTVPVKKWSATSSEISMELDDENIQVAFSDAFKEIASISDASLPALEKEMQKEMKKEISGFAKSTIKDLTDQSFTIVENGSDVVFKRVK